MPRFPHVFRLFLRESIDFHSAFLPLVTSMFLHAGIAHIAGNMLFLWIFGDNVEDFFGHFTYLFFYLVCGIGSALLHVLFQFDFRLAIARRQRRDLGRDGRIPGFYPGARILTLVFIFLVPIPAIFILGYWFFLQFVAGVTSLGAVETGGVAWWAHIGGFLIGMTVAGMARSGSRAR